jgi:hypothetical protein
MEKRVDIAKLWDEGEGEKAWRKFSVADKSKC